MAAEPWDCCTQELKSLCALKVKILKIYCSEAVWSLDSKISAQKVPMQVYCCSWVSQDFLDLTLKNYVGPLGLGTCVAYRSQCTGIS